MTYHYECDGFCQPGTIRSGRPSLTAEFNEHWYETSQYGDFLREHEYEKGDLITLCPECVQKLLIERP